MQRSTATTIDPSRFASGLTVCFIASFGISLSFLPFLPLNPDTPIFAKTFLFPLSQASLGIALLVSLINFALLYLKRERLHREQSAFWPMQCSHCASVLMIPCQQDPDPLPPGLVENHDNDAAVANASSTTLTTPCESTGLTSVVGCSVPEKEFYGTFRRFQTTASGRTLQTIIDPLITSTNDYDMRDNTEASTNETFTGVGNSARQLLPLCSSNGNKQLKNTITKPLYTPRHRSLPNVLLIFATMAVVGVTSEMIERLICLSEGQGSAATLMPEIFMNMSYTIFLITAVIGIRVNYDVVFTDATILCHQSALYFTIFFWVAFREILFPISNFINNANSQPDHSFQVHGNFSESFLHLRKLVSPCYEEFAVTGTTITLQLWSSLLPRSVILIPEGPVSFERTEQKPIFILRILTKLRSCKIHNAFSSLNNFKESSQNFGSQFNSKLSSKITLAVSLVVAITFFVFIHVTLTKQTSCVKCIFEMIFNMSFLLLCYCHFYFTKSFWNFKTDRQVLSSQGLFGGHDILLLLCASGMFVVYLLRIISAAGLLLLPRDQSRPEDYSVEFYSLVVASSLVAIVFVGIMSFFLVSVQRQTFSTDGQKRWTLACLIHATIVNITHWLLGVLGDSDSPVVEDFFGKHPGHFLEVFFEPFSTLYGLHAAMVAYETYKSLSVSSRQR